MNREAFKQRMQNLKSYREQNPGKGYLDWKASLPDNLQDESSYNLLLGIGALGVYSNENTDNR